MKPKKIVVLKRFFFNSIKVIATFTLLLCMVSKITAQKNALRFQFDNDWLTDQYYTAGLELAYHRVLDRLPRTISTAANNSFGWTTKYGFKIFTPNVYDEAAINVMTPDRPFAGYQYLGIGIQKFTSSTKFQSYDLIIGQVGPQTGMEKVQRVAHKFAGYEPIFGWENQIANKTVFDLQYRWVKDWRIDPTLAIAITNSAQLGTSSNYITTGFNLRLGSFSNIKSSNWLRPFISTSTAQKKSESYMITGLRMKYVASNIFLEGTLLDNTSPVWINPRSFVFEGDLGFLFSHKKTSVALIGVFQGREFDEGKGHFYLNFNIARSF